jgi:hypothetical protein
VEAAIQQLMAQSYGEGMMYAYGVSVELLQWSIVLFLLFKARNKKD